MKKLRIGIFSFTADEGCAIVFEELFNTRLFEWKDLIEVKSARILQTRSEIKNIDVAFVEGAIAAEKDIKKLKKIRKNSRKLVAIGSCAISGEPSNHRNFFDAERLKEIELVLKRFKHLPKVSPLKEFVKVDAEVPGCPMDEGKLLELMGKYLAEFNVKGGK